jgi:hypothetical protein
MRKLLLILFAIYFAGCGGDQADQQPPAEQQVTDSTDSTSDVVEPASSNPVADTAPAVSGKLPFDMPIMPGARYKSGMDFSKPSKRRGPEAIATIIATGTTLEVVAFYETALRENGFTPTMGSHNDESTATVRGIRENGEAFSVTSMRGGSKAAEGECQTTIVATKPKPEEESP